MSVTTPMTAGGRVTVRPAVGAPAEAVPAVRPAGQAQRGSAPAARGTLRLLVGHPCRLTGEVLAQSMGAMGGVAAMKLVHGLDQLADVAAAWHPDVVLLAGVAGPSPMELAQRVAERGRCGVVVVATEPSRAAVDAALSGGNISLLSHHAAMSHLVHAIRGTAMGCPTIDASFVPTTDGAEPSPLTPREREVLLMTADGHPIKEIATRLYLTPGTVRNISSAAIRKVDARNRFDAARKAHSKGWL